MKYTLALLISFSATAATYNSEIGCERAEFNYSFKFAAPRLVTVDLSVKGPNHEHFENMEGKSVLYSEGRLVGFVNPVTHDEEMFQMPRHLFNPLELNLEMKVTGQTRSGGNLELNCKAIQ
jgi:hypothetical protein